MKPLFVLCISFAITLLIIKWITGNYSLALAGRISLGIMLCFTAIGHFIFPDGMSKMVFDFLPCKKQIVYLTGVLEILFAFGLIYPNRQWNQYTAIVLIIFFIAILPGNIKAATEHLNYQTGSYDGPGLSYLWFRIPFQLLLIGWTYIAAYNPSLLSFGK